MSYFREWQSAAVKRYNNNRGVQWCNKYENQFRAHILQRFKWIYHRHLTFSQIQIFDITIGCIVYPIYYQHDKQHTICIVFTHTCKLFLRNCKKSSWLTWTSRISSIYTIRYMLLHLSYDQWSMFQFVQYT